MNFGFTIQIIKIPEKIKLTEKKPLSLKIHSCYHFYNFFAIFLKTKSVCFDIFEAGLESEGRVGWMQGWSCLV